MSFRSILIPFSMCIIWSLFSADSVFSFYIDEQENIILHSPNKKKTKKVKKDKKSNKRKQEQITKRNKQEQAQPKPLIIQQHSTTEIVHSSKNQGVHCLEELGPKELRDLFQADSKSILLNNFKISILSRIEEGIIKEIDEQNTPQISAVLDKVIQSPPSHGLRLKGSSVTGEYSLFRGESLIDALHIKIRFTRYNPAFEGGVLSVENGED